MQLILLCAARCQQASTLILYDSFLRQDTQDVLQEEAWGMGDPNVMAAAKRLQGLALVHCDIWDDGRLSASVLKALPYLR